MLHFCTLFDANYLSRGLVTYDSLMKATAGGAHLYVFAFDDLCYDTLQKMQLPHLTPIKLADFEDEALLAVKPTRSRGEYCWTCTSSTILYCIKTFNLPHCTYIDADMYFFNDPQVLFDELPTDAHVIITEHRYTPQYDKSKLSGRYCVQFMYFDNTEKGLKVLNWWREQCLSWCYNRHEDGKFGDQKYLDDWCELFEGVYELKHLGAGLAPWNIQQFNYHFDQTALTLELKHTYADLYFNEIYLENGGTPYFKPIFFHFHGVKIYENGAAIYAPKMYILNRDTRQYIYEPYVQRLKAAQDRLRSVDLAFDKVGLASTKQFHEDRRKGWWGFIKTNLINKLLKIN